jgi:anti-sigma factor RsiW
MSQACATWRGDIGAYIVGALSAQAGARVQRHLQTCAGCRADYNDLVPVRDWLSKLALAGQPPARRGKSAPPPEPVRPPRRRTRRRLLAGAVAAGGAAAVILAITSGPAPPAFQSVDRATGIHGQARLTATSAGTQIDLSVTGMPAGQRCTLLALSENSADPAGSWIANYDGTAQVEETTAIPLSRLTALRIESSSRQLLLSIPI